MAESSTDALSFLQKPSKDLGPIVAVFGAEPYLVREVLRTIRGRATGSDEELSPRVFEGKDSKLSDIVDELSTVSLFGAGGRLVIVEDADSFVTEHRAGLESYVTSPASGALLVLMVKSWPSNTRLAKAAAAAGGLAIRCEPPKLPQLRNWLQGRATEEKVTLGSDALDLLLDLAPSEIGILEQELSKLIALVGPEGEITSTIVHDNVGGGRVRQTWDMIDTAAHGDAADALRQLDRLLAAGEDPLGLLPQMAGVLRRFVAAGRLVEAAERSGKRPNLRTALQEAGVPHFKVGEAERQLRQIGRARVGKLLSWLLEADLALKGSHSRGGPARRVLETLIVRLSKAADERKLAERSH